MKWLLLVCVVGVVAVIAMPALSDSTQPSLVSTGAPCVDTRDRHLETTTDPAPAQVTTLLAVLRRPQRPSDRIPNPDDLALLPISGVNLDAIRLARAAGPRIYLVPAGNVRYFRPLPDTPGCQGIQPPAPKPAAGVCLVERGSNGAASCADVTAIRNGRTLLTGGGRRHGVTRAAGIARDGVKAIIWRVHRGNGFLDTRVPVRNNVFVRAVPSRAGHGLYVFWVTANGRRLVIGPHHFTKRERSQLRREHARDLAAGPKPSIFPRSGTARTIFTFRMRVAHPGRAVYVASWTAPTGSPCENARPNGIGMLPASSGELKGLIRAGFGPPLRSGWCRGTYDGSVRKQRRGARTRSGPALARFSFSVR